jgi:hypothetical protein
MNEIFTPEELKDAFVEKAYTFNSSYFENNGNGTFTIKELPQLTQISQVNAIIADDFDKDGFEDALIAGNNFSLTPEQGRLDAGTGLFLQGNGKGNFNAVQNNGSGFFANKDVKSMVVLNAGKNSKIIVIGNNNDVLQFFVVKK